MSPISSRKSVPPSACSKRPRRVVCAPVKAPRSWPNSSDSSRSFGIAAVLMATNGPLARAVLVQRVGDQLLARARLAGDQHRDDALAQPADRPEHVLHRRRLAEDLRHLGGHRLGLAPRAGFLRRRGGSGRPPWARRRAWQVVEGAAPEGADGAVVRSEYAVMMMTGRSRCLALILRAARCPSRRACGCRRPAPAAVIPSAARTSRGLVAADDEFLPRQRLRRARSGSIGRRRRSRWASCGRTRCERRQGGSGRGHIRRRESRS